MQFSLILRTSFKKPKHWPPDSDRNINAQRIFGVYESVGDKMFAFWRSICFEAPIRYYCIGTAGKPVVRGSLVEFPVEVLSRRECGPAGQLRGTITDQRHQQGTRYLWL
jgi:hypothetical protein